MERSTETSRVSTADAPLPLDYGTTSTPKEAWRILCRTASVFTGIGTMLFAILSVLGLSISFSSLNGGEDGAGYLVLAILFMLLATIGLWGTISLIRAGRPRRPGGG